MVVNSTAPVISTPPNTVDTNGNPITRQPNQRPRPSQPLRHRPRCSRYQIETAVQTIYDADEVDSAPVVAGDDNVLITYTVTNPGNTPLNNVSVTDDTFGTPTYTGGDTDGDNQLDTDETWTYTLTIPAGTPGIHNATGTTAGTAPETVATDGATTPTSVVVSDTDPHWYEVRQVRPSISIRKTINGLDASVAPGVQIAPGDSVTFDYHVTNTGNVPLTQIAVLDDQEGPAVCPDVADQDWVLDIGASTICSITVAINFVDQYENIGSVTAVGIESHDSDGNPVTSEAVSDSDEVHANDRVPVENGEPVDDPPPTDDGEPPNDPPPESLARTGSDAQRLTVTGLSLIAAGAFISGQSRRRREDF